MPSATIYLVLVAFAALATILALAPVSLHRALFRQGAKPQIVHITNRLLMGALASVAVTLIGTSRAHLRRRRRAAGRHRRGRRDRRADRAGLARAAPDDRAIGGRERPCRRHRLRSPAAATARPRGGRGTGSSGTAASTPPPR